MNTLNHEKILNHKKNKKKKKGGNCTQTKVEGVLCTI